jgi:hypothetical protein
MKDYARKNYSDHQYRDWMRNVTSKSIFNDILEQYPGQGEFSRTRPKTSLDRAVESFLKQSWLKKTHSNKDFKDMEEDWEGLPGFRRTEHDASFSFDHPWNMQSSATTSPWSVIFDLNSTSKYCPGETSPFTMSGTHPIYHLGLSFERSGTTIKILGGYGTNTVTGEITASEDEWASIDFNASMIAFVGADRPGIVGTSNYLMPASGSGCCDPESPLEPDDASNPNTMASNTTISIYVLFGTPPFQWSVTGASGFTLGQSTTTARENTLIAASGACGSPRVTVTDKCNTEVEIVVRCTNNSGWKWLGSGCWNPGAATWCRPNGLMARRITGRFYQEDQYGNLYCWGTQNCANCGDEQYSGTACITFDCNCIMSDPSWPCPEHPRKCMRTCCVDKISSIAPYGWEWRCN